MSGGMEDCCKEEKIIELKEVEIVASYSGKISTGRFENESPFFSLKETWIGIDDLFIRKRQKDLYKMCYDRFSECEKKSIAERILEQRNDMRFYSIAGDQYPSVTSIINWDKDFYCSQEELSQYAARGIIIHKQVELFLLTKEWHEPKDIPEVYPQMVILKKGTLQLSLEGYNFRNFFSKYPMSILLSEKEVVNKEHKYAGRFDFKCKFNDVVTLCDIKTGTVDKSAALQQLTAYAHCPENEDVKQLMIIPLTDKTKQGFSEPIIETNLDKYWHLFLEKRKLFCNRFGL